jgi:hypothetical protein
MRLKELLDLGKRHKHAIEIDAFPQALLVIFLNCYLFLNVLE